ncbi:MAG TPA: SsrA-binding protein SmpB [Dehalococcoidia bacterium]|nr:SsrA-binding protein SmpB [Dehalococcoidia bacterium]
MAEIKQVAANRKATHDYEILQRVEAGISLLGTEIKSIRTNGASIREAYARPLDGELWLYGAHIAPYEGGSYMNHEPTRPRRLLLHKKEIRELSRAMNERGLTLVPLSLYLKDGMAKVELGLARGRKHYDKRQAIAKRDAQRDIERALRHRSR